MFANSCLFSVFPFSLSLLPLWCQELDPRNKTVQWAARITSSSGRAFPLLFFIQAPTRNMSTRTRQPSCNPTWNGYVETTRDALLIFEACFQGVLQRCSRRPHDRERESLITSGNVFVYEDVTSGIKRWTDGIPWSPSRILTNFLIYRQLNNPFPPGEKKRANKRTSRPPQPGEPYSTLDSTSNTSTADYHNPFPPGPRDSTCAGKDDQNPDKDSSRGLVGSLVDSYEFEEGGLIKKTIKIVCENRHHHLVSYYCLEDVKHNLKTPRDDPRVQNIIISQELLSQPQFKYPNMDDAGNGAFKNQDMHQNGGYYYPNDGYYYPNGGYYGPCLYGTAMEHSHSTAYPPPHPPTAGNGSLPPSISMPYSAAAQHRQYAEHYYPPQANR